MIPALLFEIFSFWYCSFFNRTYYFTQIGQMIGNISIILSVHIIRSQLNNKKVSLRLLRLTHILSEFAIIMQVTIFIVYWTRIHFQIIERIRSKGQVYEFYMIFVHIIPNIATFIDFGITKYVIIKEDLKYFIVFWLLYGVNNWLQTLFFVRTPYPFLLWESYSDIFVIIIFVFVFIFIYLGIYKLAKILNASERSPTKKQK